MNVEVYAPSNEIEGQRIVGFLKEKQIDALFETQDELPLLPTVGTHKCLILVDDKNRKAATELIATARLDGVITDTGVFL